MSFAERVYVGIDIGYREHVAAACPASALAPRGRDAWTRCKTLRFKSDADGFSLLKTYLEGFSTNPSHFLILLEPTGSYGIAAQAFLVGNGYAVLQVAGMSVKQYREKLLSSDTKTDDVDARLLSRMGFLHESVGEKFSIQPVRRITTDSAALRPMVVDYLNIQKEISRRKNQLQQINGVVFPELKTMFTYRSAGPAVLAILGRYSTTQELGEADPDEVASLLRRVRAYRHAKQAGTLVALARGSAGISLPGYQWRQQWLVKLIPMLEERRDELIKQLELVCRQHPYTSLIESLPVRGPIWTAILIAVIVDVNRFANYGDFRAYVGWYSAQKRSGTSVRSSYLTNKGVRMARRVLWQMVIILISPRVRANPFKACYQRLIGRGMRPMTATGHLAGKLSTVIYMLLKTGTAYDEKKHWKALGFPEPAGDAAGQAIEVAPPCTIEEVVVPDDALLVSQRDVATPGAQQDA